MQSTNDELFKNYLEYVNQFVIPDIIKKDSENFKIALIDITRNIEKLNQTTEERMYDVVTSTHKVMLQSMIMSFETLIADYNQWLLNNYRIEPLADNEFPED